MRNFRLNNLNITLEREGAKRFTKASYPIRYGRYSEIETREYLLQYNLNGGIKYIRGLNQDWPHPAEWLKRTEADDWVYYTAGGYRGIFHTLGEYYLPCLSYPSNSVYGYNPFGDDNIQKALRAWTRLQVNLRRMRTNGIPSKVKDFLFLISSRDSCALRIRSEKLHRIKRPIRYICR